MNIIQIIILSTLIVYAIYPTYVKLHNRRQDFWEEVWDSKTDNE